MGFSRIIIKPLQSEKIYSLQSLENKKYAFMVNPSATKKDIMLAFMSIYGIKPSKIAIQNRKPVKIRTGTMKPGYSKLIKIAFVTLPKGSDISNKSEVSETTKTKKESPQIEKQEIVKTEITKEEIK